MREDNGLSLGTRKSLIFATLAANFAPVAQLLYSWSLEVSKLQLNTTRSPCPSARLAPRQPFASLARSTGTRLERAGRRGCCASSGRVLRAIDIVRPAERPRPSGRARV